MKAKFWTRLFCLVLVLSLIALPGCGSGSGIGGGSKPGKFEDWDESKGTTHTTQLEDGGKKIEKKDLDGKLVQAEYYDEEGDLDHYTTYEYDSTGKILKEETKGPKDDIWDGCEYIYDAEGKLTSKKITDYRGVVVEEEFYLPDGTMVQRLTYRYDDNGNVINIRYYDGERTFLGCADQIFDENGRMIRRVEMDYLEIPKRTYDYNADGSMVETLEVMLDDGYFGSYAKLVTNIDPTGKRLNSTGYNYQGEKTSYTEYNDDGSGTTWRYYIIYEGILPETVQYETIFDKDNQFVKETFYHSETGKIITVKDGIFDESGKLIGKEEHSWWPDGTLGHYIKYTADDLMLLYENYLEDGTLDHYEEFQYDEKGNLILCDLYNGDGSYKGYQAYTYYENGAIKSFREYYADGNAIYGEDYDENGVPTGYYEYLDPEE